jgi:hypothetical protein
VKAHSRSRHLALLAHSDLLLLLFLLFAALAVP